MRCSLQDAYNTQREDSSEADDGERAQGTLPESWLANPTHAVDSGAQKDKIKAL